MDKINNWAEEMEWLDDDDRLVHFVCDCFSGIPLSQAKAIEPSDLEALGIKELLTAQRRNGLGSLIKTIIYKVGKL